MSRQGGRRANGASGGRPPSQTPTGIRKRAHTRPFSSNRRVMRDPADPRQTPGRDANGNITGNIPAATDTSNHPPPPPPRFQAVDPNVVTPPAQREPSPVRQNPGTNQGGNASTRAARYSRFAPRRRQ